MLPLFRVLDTETTGFDAEQEGVVEVAAVDVVGGEVVADRQHLVHPGIPIPSVASAIHHLTDADVAGAPALPEVWPEYTAVPPGHELVMVAHNAAFDAPFVGAAPNGWLCTYRLASHLLPDAPAHKNQVLRYHLDLNVPQAQGLAAHRALADAYVTAALLVHLLGEARQQGLTTLGDLLRYCWQPIIHTQCRFGKHRGKQWSQVPRDYLEWMIKQGAGAWDSDTWATIHHHMER